MKGLLYKEFCIGRKTYFSFLALTLVFVLLGILVCLSMLCGNLQEFAKDRKHIPMSLKYKTARAVSNRLVLVLAAAYILCGIKIMGMVNAGEEVMEQYCQEVMAQFAKVRDVLLLCSPQLVALMVGISFVLSVKIYQRRES